MARIVFRGVPLLVLAMALPALAVTTSHWTQSNEAQFGKGAMDHVVATNLGDLELSRAVKRLLEEDARVSSVNCMIEAPDGTVYAGTGPHGVLLSVKNDHVSTFATFANNTLITALAIDAQGRLLIGASGLHGRVYRIDPAHYDPHSLDAAKIKPVFEDDAAQYVWAIQLCHDGSFAVATGPNGDLFEIDASGKKTLLFHSDEENMLCMTGDGGDLLYVGTDPSGLIYRVNRKTREAFVLFNAPEAEITCLALDAKGNLYAGTGEVSEHPAKPQANPADEKVGRPEGTGGVPIPSRPPATPAPPPPPTNPGEPHPIPKGKTALGYGPTAWGDWMRIDSCDRFMDDSGDAPTAPGALTPATAPAQPTAQPPQPQQTAPAAGDQEQQNAKPGGNAIYRIDKDGFVREIFRQNVLVYCMIERGGTLLVGTGGDGMVYQVNPAAQETLVLARTEQKQIVSMLPTRDGRVLLGLANVGGIVAMSDGFASSGTMTSNVLDATQISRFGKVHLEGSLPPDTTLSIATRSGNVQDPSKVGWSKWSAPMPALSYIQVPSPNARFLQYRLTFNSKDGKDSPVVNLVDVAYQVPNMAPVVKGIKVAPKAPENPQEQAMQTANPTRLQTIAWDAEDPNGDALTYSLYYRAGSSAPWVLLKDRMTDTHFDWDTRQASDGRYELKVIASDALANVPGEGKTGSRISDPIVVDNTPPAIGDVKMKVDGASVHIDAKLADRTSTVAACDYSVDSSSDWQAVLPSDRIFDSPEESVAIAIAGLKPGAHEITLRATDSRGNQAYQTLLVRIEAPAAGR